MKKGTLLALPLLLGATVQAAAHEAPGYWTDGHGHPLVDRNGDCVRTGNWHENSTAPAGCEGAQDYQQLRHISLAAGTSFEFDSATLKPEGKRQLREIADKVVRLGSRVDSIRVDGHTDSVGNEDYNMRLSQDRAQSVADYLTEQGVSADKIQTRGYGESSPVADNNTKAGRKQNRRVEIRVEGDY